MLKVLVGLSLVYSQSSFGVYRSIINKLCSKECWISVPINEVSVKKMEINKRRWRGQRHVNEQNQLKYCTECGYKSDRRFNVERHRERIHSNSIVKKCCNILFVTKSDFYHHMEDYHPNIRSSCFVSKKKYKIYGHTSKLSIVNSSNISSDHTTTRRSIRIQEQTIKKRKLTEMKISTAVEIHACEESEKNDGNMDNDKREHIQENINTVSKLPLKKRILCEINDNVNNRTIQTNNKKKIKKISFDENQNPIDLFFNEYRGATIVQQILTMEESMQMWQSITQHQRDYLKHIDFNSL